MKRARSNNYGDKNKKIRKITEKENAKQKKREIENRKKVVKEM